MTTHRDPETTVAAWLHEGPTDLPDVTRRAILTALPMTPQARRGPFAPGRLIPMNPLARLAIAVVVAAIAAGAGFAFLGNTGPSVGGPPTPTVSPTQDTPRPTPTASSSPSFDISTPSPLQGRATRLPVAFSYVLPAGADLVVSHDDPYTNFYQFRRQNLDDGSWAGALIIRAVTGGRQDPCGVTSSNNRPLADPQAFVDCFRTIPTVSVSDVTSASIDGHPGLSSTLTFGPATTACPDVWLWYEDGSITQNGGRQPVRVTILDVDGHHYALLTPLPDSPLYEASQGLVGSIRFDANATPTASGG
jgi:hypothetical protein